METKMDNIIESNIEQDKEPTTKKKARLSIQQMALMGVMTALICVLAPMSLSIPISPVPISLTILAIFISIFALGMWKSTICCLLYLLLGLVGLPVFSGFSSGPAKLLGATGGYLIGFIFLTLITGFFVDRWMNKPLLCLIGMILGIAVCYTFGTAWLAYVGHMSFRAALMAGVIPFIPADLVKTVIALIIGPQLHKTLVRAHVI